MSQGRAHHPRSSLKNLSRQEWHVCRDCLDPLAHELDGIKEEWFHPPRDVTDDEREDHHEVFERHGQHCLSLETTERVLRQFDFDRAILWMKANQREMLARETEDLKDNLVAEFREPIPTDIDRRNARAQMLADFAYYLYRIVQELDESVLSQKVECSISGGQVEEASQEDADGVPQEQQGESPEWWCDVEPEEGSKFKYGPLVGSLNSLARWTKRDPRTLRGKNTRVHWIKKGGHDKEWEMWFTSQHAFAQAEERCDAEAQEGVRRHKKA